MCPAIAPDVDRTACVEDVDEGREVDGAKRHRHGDHHQLQTLNAHTAMSETVVHPTAASRTTKMATNFMWTPFLGDEKLFREWISQKLIDLDEDRSIALDRDDEPLDKSRVNTEDIPELFRQISRFHEGN